MILSRVWIALLSLALAGALFTLYLAQSMYNRSGGRVLAEGLSSDSQVVSWYMRHAARERSSRLINATLNPEIIGSLAAASRSRTAVPAKAKAEAKAGIKKFLTKNEGEFAFDAVFAVDQYGRVVAVSGYDAARGYSEFELGGYPVVADALRGYIRDDVLAWDRLFTAVARPVEAIAGEPPIGAVIGMKAIDDRFARKISERTGTAVAFYHDGERVSSGAPPSFNKALLDGIVSDMVGLADDQDYQGKGRSAVRYLSDSTAVVYARLQGTTWKLGSGYVVGREASKVSGPFAFFANADDKDKASANFFVVGLALLLALGIGLLFTFLEHTKPLNKFRGLAEELAGGKIDQLPTSRVSGGLRKIAGLFNDGMERVAVKGGGTRRAADLSQVLGDIPDEPSMSAFTFSEPQAATTNATGGPATDSGLGRLPPAPGGLPPAAPAPGLPRPPRQVTNGGAPPAGVQPPSPRQGSGPANGDNPEWEGVYREYLQTRQACGESTEGLSFDKFMGTLQRNREAIIKRHGVSRVKFSVYVKQGRAALKANPIRE